MKAVLRYTQNRYEVSSPTYTDINKALGNAMKMIARADSDKSKDLSDAEMKTLAKTWDAIVDFAKEYQGSSVEDLTGHTHEYES
jgi:CRISPR/Cas system CSM-associated protein Csm2 small subunit